MLYFLQKCFTFCKNALLSAKTLYSLQHALFLVKRFISCKRFTPRKCFIFFTCFILRKNALLYANALFSAKKKNALFSAIALLYAKMLYLSQKCFTLCEIALFPASCFIACKRFISRKCFISCNMLYFL